MRILYIYPHPDDESFGPAHVMHKQRREGHEVHLLTLTRGGATRQRHKYGYSVNEMGEVRYREMLGVADALKLNGMTVLDLPDSGLKEMDPREIEDVVRRHILELQPQVAVLAYQFGDGFTNILVPTNAVLIGILTMSGVPYERWVRFVLPFMLKIWGAAAIALIVAVTIGYS